MKTAIEILQTRADFIANYINEQTPTKLKNELNEINKAIKILSKNDDELPRSAPGVYQARGCRIHSKTNTDNRNGN